MTRKSEPDHDGLRDHCPLCHSEQTAPSFHSIRGGVFCCRHCGVFFVDYNHHTPQNQAALFYSTLDEQKYKAYFEPFRKGQFRSVVQALNLAPGSSLLDVGASYGWMVEVGLELGFESYGLEPGDVQYPASLTRRILHTTLNDYNPGRTFDLVTIWHVLEHLQDPVEAIQKLESLLSPEGRLVIAVPTTDGRMFQLGLLLEHWFGRPKLLNELFYFHNPNMHFFYHNEQSVRELLRLAGLTAASVQTIEAFDWTTIYQRVDRPLRRAILKLAGPLVASSGFTRRENLIVVARKGDPELLASPSTAVRSTVSVLGGR